ncbi:unnamed protein product [Brachionus calyciflorus]|uniref:Uncharacterized protein n=1 Tax=Brachionus calyciflorus TaxID=104777 RepID=A0A813M997_9BILA|nr:unnamed protein product [Brachionus calyciflorus]
MSTNKPTKKTFSDPIIDSTFNIHFGNEQNKNILISLINNLLGFDGANRVKDVKVLLDEPPVKYSDNCKEVLQISCTNFKKKRNNCRNS